jgi:5'-nucleotidase (lipoprotein e(P4) family)
MHSPRPRARAGRLLLAAGATLACRTTVPPAPGPAPVATPAAVGPYAPRGLLPREVRWFRTSAERRALYLQGYRVATERLPQLAAGRAADTWAVILDADETVLDNGAYQQERAALDSAYTPESWRRWVDRRAAAALPGAAAFVAAVRAAGGRPVIVTNRDAQECEATRDNLRAVGITVDAVLCKGTTSDKNPRFAEVARGAAGLPPLAVVMWVGDNIQDFPALTQRTTRGAPDAAFAEFGSRFVLLPNPMYGSWEENPVPVP